MRGFNFGALDRKTYEDASNVDFDMSEKGEEEVEVREENVDFLKTEEDFILTK